MSEEYLHFLKYKKKPSKKTLNHYLTDLELLEKYLREFKDNKDILDTQPEDIEDFANWVKEKEPQKVENCCKSISIYFEFVRRYDLQAKAIDIMWQSNDNPLEMWRIQGCHTWTTWFLKQKGIGNVHRMIEYCDTKEKRESLAEVLEVPVEEITELAKIAELTRIPGLKSKRARLYYDSGFDTLTKIADSTAEEIIQKTADYIVETDFDGWPPAVREAEEAINIAKHLKTRISE